jgi:hypothetical protein
VCSKQYSVVLARLHDTTVDSVTSPCPAARRVQSTHVNTWLCHVADCGPIWFGKRCRLRRSRLFPRRCVRGFRASCEDLGFTVLYNFTRLQLLDKKYLMLPPNERNVDTPAKRPGTMLRSGSTRCRPGCFLELSRSVERYIA